MSNRRAVRLTWSGTGLRFTGGGTDPATPAITVDGDGTSGPSPMIALLLAAAGCSASDVVVLLGKMRVQLTSCAVDVEGARRDEEPRRYISIRFHFRLAGQGLDRAKAERAVSLSLSRYCSVVHSLASDIRVEHEIELG